jgi:hypothetical protein
MGSVNLDNTGSGSAITLSSDGTNLLLNGTAIGGGGGGDPDLYRDNASSPTTPLAGGANGVAIGSGSNAGGSGAIALGVGSAAGDGAFCAINGGGNTSYGAVGNRSIAMGEAARASASDAVAIGENAYAQGAESFSIGTQTDAIGTRAGAFAYNALAQGNYSMAFGNAGAFGTESFAAAIANNTNTYGASGANSIAMGYQAKATSPYSTVSGGNSNVASGYHATVVGGSSNLADNIGSTVLGGRYGTTRGIRGAAIFGGYGNQITATQGTSQSGLYILAEQTTDATTATLKTDNQSSSSTANQIVLPNGGAYAFTGTIVGREAASSGTECAAWKVEGLIRREGSAGTTVLVNSATTVLNNAPSWGMALSANTSLGCLKIEVTGAAKTIRWVATIQTTELTFA